MIDLAAARRHGAAVAAVPVRDTLKRVREHAGDLLVWDTVERTGQDVDAEHVAAGGAIGDVGEPDRQGRAQISADLVFAAERQQGREAAGRAAIKHQRHEQPHRGLEQHGDPDDQPRPRANELDDQGGIPHATSERCSQPVKPALFAHDYFDRGRGAS